MAGVCTISPSLYACVRFENSNGALSENNTKNNKQTKKQFKRKHDLIMCDNNIVSLSLLAYNP